MRINIGVLGMAVACAAACGSSSTNEGAADPITGTWAGKFDNGISISVPLALTDSTISGTFNTGDSQGTVSGIYSSATFTIQLAATSGTQRTLSNQQLINAKKRITAHWNDGGGGLSGEMCLAAPGSTACP